MAGLSRHGFLERIEQVLCEYSVLQWRFIDSVAARIDDAALREARSRKDAIRAYEIVYKALGDE